MAALASGLILPWAFRAETAQKYRDEQRRLKVHAISTASVSIFKYSATWFSAAYLLLYAGTESSISGWIISFMLRIRQASPHISSLCSAGFWAGMTGGRLILGGITDRVGVTRGVLYFMICAIGLQLVFFAVQDEVVSLMLIIMIGFFFGPLFPSCIVQLTQLLPQALSVQAVSFVASVGQLGGACLPFGVGALSQLLGLQVFGMVIVVQLTICVFLWILLGRSQMKKSLERVDDEGGIGRHMD
jgi:fucose permease